MAVLEGKRAHSDGAADSLIFLGVAGRPLNGDTLIKALRRATGTDADVHGFRSSFRAWAAERSGATRDVAELALAHVVGGAVEPSYAPSDLFDQRRGMMDRWAALVAPRACTVARPRCRKRMPPLVAQHGPSAPHSGSTGALAAEVLPTRAILTYIRSRPMPAAPRGQRSSACSPACGMIRTIVSVRVPGPRPRRARVCRSPIIGSR